MRLNKGKIVSGRLSEAEPPRRRSWRDVFNTYYPVGDGLRAFRAGWRYGNDPKDPQNAHAVMNRYDRRKLAPTKTPPQQPQGTPQTAPGQPQATSTPGGAQTAPGQPQTVPPNPPPSSNQSQSELMTKAIQKGAKGLSVGMSMIGGAPYEAVLFANPMGTNLTIKFFFLQNGERGTSPMMISSKDQASTLLNQILTDKKNNPSGPALRNALQGVRNNLRFFISSGKYGGRK